MAFLFTPTQWTNTVVLHGRGGLRYSYPVSMTAWKDANGVWHQATTPSYEDVSAALVALQGTPQIVSASIAAELIAAGIGTVTTV